MAVGPGGVAQQSGDRSARHIRFVDRPELADQRPSPGPGAVCDRSGDLVAGRGLWTLRRRQHRAAVDPARVDVARTVFLGDVSGLCVASRSHADAHANRADCRVRARSGTARRSLLYLARDPLTMRRPRLDLDAAPGQARRVIVLCLAAICVLSVPVICTRFLNDMDYYALVSDKLMRGGVLYRNAIDTKPPLVFLHYATILTLFGRGNIAAIKIVTMACLFLSSLLVWAIYKELFPRSRRPELAALLFVLASFSGWGEDFLSSNTELLSNLFVLAGVWLMVKNDFGSRVAQLLPAGVLVGLAFLYRYQAGAALVAYGFTI